MCPTWSSADGKDDELWDDYDTLIDVITETVKPTTWDQVGGPGSITGASIGTAKVLIVSQTYEVQGEIARLLADIREIAKKKPDAELPRREKASHPKPSSGTTDLGIMPTAQPKRSLTTPAKHR